MPKIEIDGHNIGNRYAPYLIAELSANHNGSIETAFRIIEQAKLVGADAIKIQTYKPDTITLDGSSDDFKINGGPWGGRTLYELYEEAHLPWEWHSALFDYARKIGITIFSSPFDNTAVDLLENLNAPAYKIASFEAVDLQLIKYAASTRKPIIISTGMANFEEISEAIAAARDGGAKEIAILHCVSGYPAPAEDYNLKTIPDMINKFNVVTGISDHTLENATAVAAVALGASIIEKHFTLNRLSGGPDDGFSLEPDEMKCLSRDIKTAWLALGSINYTRKASELGNVKFRRSIYSVKNIRAGEVITSDCVRSIRPGYGLSPKYLSKIIGSIAAVDIPSQTAITKDLFTEKQS